MKGPDRAAGESIGGRIKVLLDGGATGDTARDLLAEGYAHALVLDRERLAIERSIIELTGRVEDPAAARALRRAWMRKRTLKEELRQLRDLLHQLGELHAAAARRDRPEGRPA